MRLTKKIALIELTTYHEECLYTQIKFLQDADYNITLITHPKNKQNLKYYGLPSDNVRFFDPRGAKNVIKRILNWFALYNYIKKVKFEKVIFNTASSNKEIIALATFLPKSIARYGSIHNLRKLDQSASQKIISRSIKDYYVLNDFLVDSCTLKDKNIRRYPYYPIFFPKYPTSPLKKKEGDIWICVPGELNYKRRDYDIVCEALSQLGKDSGNLKIILLGKMNPAQPDAQKFLNTMKSLQLERYMVTFDSFVSNDIFHSYLKVSDYIMAPVATQELSYLKYKITGAYNLAFAYRKPLICPQAVSIIPDLRENSHFYNTAASLALLLEQIAQKRAPKLKSYTHAKWDYTEQLKKYLDPLQVLNQ
jgi:hypothetical protein